MSDGKGWGPVPRPVYDWEKPYYPNYHEDMDMIWTIEDELDLEIRGLREEVGKAHQSLRGLQTILGEVRRMLEEGVDPTGIIGYIDESLPRVRR